MKTKQETFDIVAEFLLKQGKRCCFDDGTCVYRGPNNTKCAAGCLIPDDKYLSLMDNRFGIIPYIATDPIISEVLESEGYDPFFVKKLQEIHDSSGDEYTPWLEDWKNAMINFARDNDLSIEVFK